MIRFTPVKEFIYTNRKSITDYSNQAFTQCWESERKRNSDAAYKASWGPGEVSPDPPTPSPSLSVGLLKLATHQSISTPSSNSTAGKLLLITSVIGDISHDVQEVNLSPLTPVLKDCIQKPENGRRLKHYIPSTTYIFESLKLPSRNSWVTF